MNRRSLPFVLFVLAVLLPCAPISAQDAAASKKNKDHKWITLMFQTENDAFGSDTDEFYTTGFRFFGMRRIPDDPSDLAGRFKGLLCGWAVSCGHETTAGFALGLQYYTPEDITVPGLIVNDRPYASWAYGSFLLNVTGDTSRGSLEYSSSKQQTFELQLGILGPSSGGEKVQTEYHELTDQTPPQGWDNQLPDEPGINFVYLNRRILRFKRTGDSFDIVPHFGGALGTVMVMANAGFTLRVGQRISGFPQKEIPTTLTAKMEQERSEYKGPEYYFFVGAEGRAVAHNVFLDGNVFRDSHSVEREDFVYDLKAGFSLRVKNWRFHYALVRRSEELTVTPGNAEDGIHEFGSFAIGVERTFK